MKLTPTRPLTAAALGLGGIVLGAAVATTFSATAADTGTGSKSSDGSAHVAETPLTGSTADKVRAAVEAKYPDATIVRLETDDDGVYEAHITRADGTSVEVEVDKSFTVTGEDTDHGGRGDHDGDGPAA